MRLALGQIAGEWTGLLGAAAVLLFFIGILPQLREWGADPLAERPQRNDLDNRVYN